MDRSKGNELVRRGVVGRSDGAHARRSCGVTRLYIVMMLSSPLHGAQRRPRRRHPTICVKYDVSLLQRGAHE